MKFANADLFTGNPGLRRVIHRAQRASDGMKKERSVPDDVDLLRHANFALLAYAGEIRFGSCVK